MTFSTYTDPYWQNPSPETEEKLKGPYTSVYYGVYGIEEEDGVILVYGMISKRVYQDSSLVIYDYTPPVTLNSNERLIVLS